MFTAYSPLFEFLQNQGTIVYLVGGAVRDLLLNHSSHDLDFVVLGDAPQLARKTANHFHSAYYLMDAEHGTARVLFNKEPFDNLVLDFSNARGGSLESDLINRDFTINAIAMDLATNKIVDPLGGAQHLRDKILKVCNPESFLQDPIRVLRAIRFSLYLNLHMDPETKSSMFQAVPFLSNVSGERQRDELFRMFGSGKSSSSLRLLHHTGILDIVIPEFGRLQTLQQDALLPGFSVDLAARTLEKLDQILDFIEGKRDLIPETVFSNLIFIHLGSFRLRLLAHLKEQLNADRSLRSLLCLAALFFPFFANRHSGSENDKAFENERASIVERMRFLALSKAEVQYFEKLLSNAGSLFDMLANAQGKPELDNNASNGKQHLLEKRDVYRYFRACGKPGIDICLFTLALLGARSGVDLNQAQVTNFLHASRDLFDGFWEHNPGMVNPQPLINGNDVINILSFPAGEKVGQILDLLMEEQAAGTIQTRDQAVDFVHRFCSDSQR